MPTVASFAPQRGTVPVSSSSLLATTPPAVAKVLSQAYPFISASDRVLGLVTWTDDDPYKSFLLVVGWCFVVRYFDLYMRYLSHLGAAVLCTLVVSGRQRKVEEHPSLDVIIQRMADLSRRAELLLEPLTSLNLTKTDLTRFLFAVLFMTPFYVAVAWYLSPRTLLAIVGALVLSWHSLWARVTRSILWRWKVVRVVVFYTTGIDFSRAWVKRGARAVASPGPTASSAAATSNVRFTYVLYENQRKWLGIGWTANMLSYERSPWSDEFLNETTAPEAFELPDSEGTGMAWRWVDEQWQVDLSNDGALAPRSKVRFTPDPGESDGYVYYDNLWKSPSAEASYSKYTRRRRWTRTAELVGDEEAAAPEPKGVPQPEGETSLTSAGSADTSLTSPPPLTPPRPIEHTPRHGSTGIEEAPEIRRRA